MEIVNLREKFSWIHDYWNPRIAGELNDSYVKLVKLKGEFAGSNHEAEDELFLVVEGVCACSSATATGTLGRGS